ncbi:hypothetical protein [Cellulomonas triticagri]|nr:hypothetical protein [Cellulomonas triticagri]
MSTLRPSWAWEMAGAGGAVLDRPVSPVFTARTDAEEWLGMQWRALRDQGVRTVVLRHEGALVPPVHDLTVVPEQMTVRPRD